MVRGRKILINKSNNFTNRDYSFNKSVKGNSKVEWPTGNNSKSKDKVRLISNRGKHW